MEGTRANRVHPHTGAPGASGSSATVHLRLREGQAELRFGKGFRPTDLAIVKAIPGRQWLPERRVWVLPDTPPTLETLKRSFGSRLVVSVAVAEEGTGRASDPKVPHAVATPASRDSFRSELARSELARILEGVRREIRTRGYSGRTERAYVAWARRFLAFHARTVDRLESLDLSHAKAFLEHLARRERLAAASRNQAASALSFMFREVLGRDDMADLPRAKGPKRLPLVLSHREVLRVLRELTGKYFLIAVLLYSAGLRVEECLRIRVKDVDFELRQILIRDGKGKKDRYVPLARRVIEVLRAQIARVTETHDGDRASGHGWAPLPGALHRKDPLAGFELGWQWVFPASTINTDPSTGRTGRRHLHVTAVQREVKCAVRRPGLTKRATCHTLRHSFATEALRGGCDIRTLQHVMGHKDIRTTMIYLHVVEQTGHCIRSPLDRPDDPDDCDVAAVDQPWAGLETDWDLAARQWDPARYSGPTPTAPVTRQHRPVIEGDDLASRQKSGQSSRRGSGSPHSRPARQGQNPTEAESDQSLRTRTHAGGPGLMSTNPPAER